MRKMQKQHFLSKLKNRQPWSIKKLEKPLILCQKIPSRKPVQILRSKSETNRSLTPQIPFIQFKSKPNENQFSSIPKDIFVLLNGSFFSSQYPLKGFYYTVSYELQCNFNHSIEMKIFFKACQDFFNVSDTIQFIFSYKGARLTCLHEIPPDSKIVIVSCTQIFEGINPAIPKNPSFFIRSTSKEESEGSKINSITTEKINSQFRKRFSHLSQNSDLQSKSDKKIRQKEESKRRKIENAKLNVNIHLKNIEKYYPRITDSEMKLIKAKYCMSESKIHRFNAKFKTLVLLSCTINPDHKIEKGINKKAFVEYHNGSKQQSFVVKRIFDAFNKIDEGTITWEEYFSTLSIIENGTCEEKLELFFKVYDSDNNGSLSFAEVQDLCKVQLDSQSSDYLIDNLSEYFASLIFDITEIKYNAEIPKEKIKEILRTRGEKSLLDMFCNFKFLKF